MTRIDVGSQRLFSTRSGSFPSRSRYSMSRKVSFSRKAAIFRHVSVLLRRTTSSSTLSPTAAELVCQPFTK
ncbi:hypothetical protein DIPPA_31675 [Diplonema papillatum]|nr:hypothetical protein DIPPA_31675 [Diplonema papillatum]